MVTHNVAMTIAARASRAQWGLRLRASRPSAFRVVIQSSLETDSVASLEVGVLG